MLMSKKMYHPAVFHKDGEATVYYIEEDGFTVASVTNHPRYTVPMFKLSHADPIGMTKRLNKLEEELRFYSMAVRDTGEKPPQYRLQVVVSHKDETHLHLGMAMVPAYRREFCTAEVEDMIGGAPTSTEHSR